MVLVIKIGPGMKKVQRMIARLPASIKKEVGEKGSRKIAMSGKNRIKRRYNALGYGRSKFSSGAGEKSIVVKKNKSGTGHLLFVANYLSLLDKPIRTHWVSIETLEAHKAHPGSTMFKKAPENFPFTRPPVLFFWRGPFITPAIQALQSDIPKILERATARAISEAAK